MKDLLDITLEDPDWMGTDDSNDATDTKMSRAEANDQGSLECERSLVLAAVRLSKSDSTTREHFLAGLIVRRNPFTYFLRDIRDQIYAYMTFPPLEDEEDAKREWDEECLRCF
ncbi:hypothetical protein E8E12_001950 [Didymella heteroderae]|uniref:Uncharacterized protein n=1 Tax=Didymella heteroderae TaxID=1769908 RepID=A0A9P5BXI5_9PLEO|nr:hypothetical protein E8E12_001950 [Didymella heteroderae]